MYVIKILAIAFAALSLYLYIFVAKRLESQVIRRSEEGNFNQNLKASMKMDAFVFMYVILRQYREHFDRRIAILSDGVIVVFCFALCLLAYLIIVTPQV